MRQFRILAIASSLIAFAAHADLIRLKNGDELEGKILERSDDAVVIMVFHGTIRMKRTIRRVEIAEISLGESRAEAVARRAKGLSTKSEPELRELIPWLEKNGGKVHADRARRRIETLRAEQWFRLNRGNLCDKCKGRKHLLCKRCAGTGKLVEICTNCFGKGTTRGSCATCKRSGVIRCPAPCMKTSVASNFSRFTGALPGNPRRDGEGDNFGKVKTRATRRDAYGNVLHIYRTCRKCGGKTNLPCPRCRGASAKQRDCPKCDKGKATKACTDCAAAGRYPCRTCRGSGLVDPEREVKLKEPPVPAPSSAGRRPAAQQPGSR